VNKIKDFFGQNKKAGSFIMLAVLALICASVISACGIEDMVRVDVPKKVAEAIDVEPTVSFSEAEVAWEDWVAYVDRESERFSKEIEKGAEIVGILRTLGDTGIALGQEAASTFPGGAFLSTGLALLGGAFLRRPGDDKREAAEKEKAYNAGLEKGEKMAQDAVSAIRELADAQTGGGSSKA
jgi:hypothetical protein